MSIKSKYNNIRVLHLNVHSVYNKVDEIAFLTASWLNNNIYSNYKIIRCDREHKKGGGIIAYIQCCVVKRSHQFNNRIKLKNYEYKHKNINLISHKISQKIFSLL